MTALLKKIYKKFRLSSGMSLIIFTFCLVIMVLLFIMVRSTTGYLLNSNLEKYLTYMHREFDTNVTELNRQIQMYALPLSMDSAATSALLDDTMPTQQKYSIIENAVRNSVLSEELVDKTAIISNYGEQLCFSNDGVDFTPVKTDFIAGASGYNIYLYDTPVDSGEKSYIVFGKKFLNYYTGKTVGYIEFYIDEDKVFSLFKNTNPEDTETFLSCNGNILSHTDKSKLGLQLYLPGILFSDSETITKLSSGKFISKYTTNIFGDLNFDMISILDRDDYFSTINMFNIFIIIILVGCIITSLLVAHLLSKKITTSISSLNNRINQFPEKLVPSTGNKHENELVSLEKRFILFEKQIDDLIEKNELEKKKQKAAELAALQAQINPHFVYNALDSVSWIAKINKQEQIENICTALASYFRLGLHNGDKFVMIKDEINHVKSYITVEQIRFPNAFTVIYDIDERIYEMMTLKIILQPIVENSIKHAFNNMTEKGIIEITGYPEGNDIVFQVSDNGCGMDFDPLTVKSNGDFRVGYGVKNVQDRLILEYGNGYGLFYDSTPGKGTTVTIRIKQS